MDECKLLVQGCALEHQPREMAGGMQEETPWWGGEVEPMKPMLKAPGPVRLKL